MSKLRFGTFLAPFHAAGENPTLALQRDLELVEHLDRLGFDEAWIGEHHSAGSEIIASPEIFIAAAAERTRQIKLGTGVTSISYHNPLWVAERMVLLDHLTRGRVMLGCGPGSLPTDSMMIGLNPTQTRELLPENLDIILRLLRGETVSAQTRTHTLVDARLHLRPYSEPLFDVAVAAVASPTGPRMAGTHGIGLLSIGATLTRTASTPSRTTGTWSRSGRRRTARRSSRQDWRLVGLMHIAETREQAYRDVEYGIEQWFRYFQKTAAFPQMAVEGGDVKEMIDFINEAGDRRDRHRRGRPRAGPEALGPVRRLRRDAAARARVGQPGGDPPVVRAGRPARDAALPGRLDDARAGHRRGQGAGDGQAGGLRRPADAGRRDDDRPVRAGARRQALRAGTGRAGRTADRGAPGAGPVRTCQAAGMADLHLSGDEQADALLGRDPLALLLGMLLDQQIPMEKAFRGPYVLAERLGGLDARALAEHPDLAAVMAQPPAVHRFPGSMATRVQQLCRALVETYDGRAENVWAGVADGAELLRRMKALPGFGDQKARIFVALLGKQYGVQPAGWREAAGDYGAPGVHRSVADVVSPQTLLEVRAYKQGVKAAAKKG